MEDNRRVRVSKYPPILSLCEINILHLKSTHSRSGLHIPTGVYMCKKVYSNKSYQGTVSIDFFIFFLVFHTPELGKSFSPGTQVEQLLVLQIKGKI